MWDLLEPNYYPVTYSISELVSPSTSDQWAYLSQCESQCAVVSMVTTEVDLYNVPT